ncbi:MAG: phosphatase PAP2 family protein [Verrucomicrobiota bacterium]
MKSIRQNPIRKPGGHFLIPTFFLLLCVAAPIFAADKYLEASQTGGIALLAPPPAPDSTEQAADLASARAVFHGRTADEETRARKDASLTLFNFTPAIGEFFQPGKLPKLEQFYQDLKPEIKEAITIPKNHWKRKRPYEIDSALLLGKPEPSFSYPSGHSAVGTIQSLLLAEIFPEKREAILAIGRNIGWDRVIIGKHFPTDVSAGRVLGQAIFRELMKSPAFQQNLAEAKAEVQAMRQIQLDKLEETKVSQ